MKTTALALAALLLFACKKKAESILPTIEKITESVYASGIVKSRDQYQVFATVNGLIKKVLVAEGDWVKKGDPLFSIENQTAQLAAENAQLAADFAAQNTNGDRLNELKSAISTARSKLANDSLMADRQRGLWAQGIGSKMQLEQLELAHTTSKNNLRAALSRLNDLKKQLGFAAAQSKKQLSISRTAAQDFVVRSKADGRIYQISKVEGEMVGPQTPLGTVGSGQDFLVEMQVDEKDIARIKKGQCAYMNLDSYKGQVFEAEVSKIDPIMNERSRTFTVEAIFSEPPPVIFPNLTTEANIVIISKDGAVTIPRAFLVDDSLVILKDKTRRAVRTGLKDYQKVEILGGLSATETILKPAGL